MMARKHTGDRRFTLLALCRRSKNLDMESLLNAWNTICALMGGFSYFCTSKVSLILSCMGMKNDRVPSLGAHYHIEAVRCEENRRHPAVSYCCGIVVPVDVFHANSTKELCSEQTADKQLWKGTMTESTNPYMQWGLGSKVWPRLIVRASIILMLVIKWLRSSLQYTNK